MTKVELLKQILDAIDKQSFNAYSVNEYDVNENIVYISGLEFIRDLYISELEEENKHLKDSI